MNTHTSSTPGRNGETLKHTSGTIQVSFIVPVYNVEPYIRECVLSILALKNISFEIILVDDGSSDRSMEVIADLWYNNSSVITVSQKNSGQSVARNKGMNLAKGDYIFFLDSDDKIVAPTLEHIFSAVRGDEDIIITDFYKWAGGKSAPLAEPSIASQPMLITGKQLLQRHFLKNFEMVIGRNIYKRSFIQQHDLSFLQGVYYEDAEWTIKCFALANKMLYINEPLYIYRSQRNGSTMNALFNERRYHDLFEVSRAINQFTYQIADKEVSGTITKFAGNLLLTALKRARQHKLSIDPAPMLDFFKSLSLPPSYNKIMKYLLVFSPTLFYKVLLRRSL